MRYWGNRQKPPIGFSRCKRLELLERLNTGRSNELRAGNVKQLPVEGAASMFALLFLIVIVMHGFKGIEDFRNRVPGAPI
jgi:hypothetical protein